MAPKSHAHVPYLPHSEVPYPGRVVLPSGVHELTHSLSKVSYPCLMAPKSHAHVPYLPHSEVPYPGRVVLPSGVHELTVLIEANGRHVLRDALKHIHLRVKEVTQA